MDKEQTFQWIIQVIKSCKSLKQVNNCKSLITSFSRYYCDTTLVELLNKEKNLMLNQVWMDNCPDLKTLKID